VTRLCRSTPRLRSLTTLRDLQYLSFPDSEPGQPPVLLRGFDKVKDLRPGETRQARFRLRNKDLAVWSVERQCWIRPEGTLRVRVGSDSRSFVGEAVDLPSLA
jgi:hypothetical protein